MLAFYYRHQGPVRPTASWENEPEDEEEEMNVEEVEEPHSHMDHIDLK
jgi:hypothetical protein